MIGTPEAKPVLNWGTIHSGRIQSAGYKYSYVHGGCGCPFCHCVVPTVGFSGVPGAAQSNAIPFAFFAQFQGAIRKISRRRTSIHKLAARASGEFSANEAICDRVPIEARARLAMSVVEVI